MKSTTTTTTTTTTTNAAPVAPVTERKLNRAAERRAAAAFLRNALIDAAAAAVRGEAFAPAPIDAAAASMASALACTKDGAEVTFAPVPAAVLFAAAVTFNSHGYWNVKGEGSIRTLCKVSAFTMAADCKRSTFVPEEKDFLKEKSAAKKSAPAPRSPFEKFAAKVYGMEKSAAKDVFLQDVTHAEKDFTFTTFAEWFTEEKRNAVTVAAAALGIAA